MGLAPTAPASAASLCKRAFLHKSQEHATDLLNKVAITASFVYWAGVYVIIRRLQNREFPAQPIGNAIHMEL
jgi:hypothetical protein